MRVWIKSPRRDICFLAGFLLGLVLLRQCPRRIPEIEAESWPKETLYAKVVEVDRRAGRTALVLVVVPATTRLEFDGVPEGISVGEIVKFNITHNRARIGSQEIKLVKITWLIKGE